MPSGRKMVSARLMWASVRPSETLYPSPYPMVMGCGNPAHIAGRWMDCMGSYDCVTRVAAKQPSPSASRTL